MRPPLSGIRVVELAGLAPGPFCGRILADWGASVIRVDKPGGINIDQLSAGKRSVIINSKQPDGAAVLHKLCNKSDVLIDPYRPGVLEKLGLGPSHLHPSNPGLVFARITGYGQTGPYSKAAGHDINYVAMSGILSRLGRKEDPPTPPINLLADFGGGGLMAAFGVAMALLHRLRTGEGQVVDCSMLEGTAYLSSWLYNMKDKPPIFGEDRGSNWLDSGSHFYDTYETSDGRHMAVGAVEPQFYHQLMHKLGLDDDQVEQFGNWDSGKSILRQRFKSKTFSEWCEIFEGSDACVTPVLSMDEAPLHPHNKHRNNFVQHEEGEQQSYVPRPAPLLSRSPAGDAATGPCVTMGQHTKQVLQELGYSHQDTEKLLHDCVVEQS